MASSSANTSGSITKPGSEGDVQQLLVDQRKRKRMQSNRESARRSRMRKQKHLDDLMEQVAQLRKDNNQILTSLNITTQRYLDVEAENSVLRAQMMELIHRLNSLNEILNVINNSNNNNDYDDDHNGGFDGSNDHDEGVGVECDIMSDNNYHFNHLMFLNQPIMDSPHLFDQY